MRRIWLRHTGLLHGGETTVWGDAGYQGIAKRPEFQGSKVAWQVAMRPGVRRPTGTGRPCEDAREVQSLSACQSGASVPVREAALRIRQGALSGSGQKHATAGVAAGVHSSADCGPPRGDLTRDKSACRSRQAMKSGGNRAPEAIGHSQNAPSDRFSASISNFPVLNELVQTFPSSSRRRRRRRYSVASRSVH